MTQVKIEIPHGTLIGGKVWIDDEPLGLGISAINLDASVDGANHITLTLPGVSIIGTIGDAVITYEVTLVRDIKRTYVGRGRTVALALSDLAEKVEF